MLELPLDIRVGFLIPFDRIGKHDLLGRGNVISTRRSICDRLGYQDLLLFLRFKNRFHCWKVDA
jgi:hypothetical protein